MTAYPSMDWRAGSYLRSNTHNKNCVVFTQPSDIADIIRKGVLLVVCDSSSNVANEIMTAQAAAQTAARQVMQSYYADNSDNHPQHLLAKAVRTATRQVSTYQAEPHPELRTAICACLVFEDTAYVAQIGQIRAYTLCHGEFGHVTGATQHQSSDLLIEAQYSLKPGDRILLCTDGIYRTLQAEQLLAILHQSLSPQQAVDALIKTAIDGNAQDDASAIALYFNSGRATNLTWTTRRKAIWQTAAFLSVLIIAVLLIGLLIFSPQSLPAMIGGSSNPTRVVRDNVVSTRIEAVSTIAGSPGTKSHLATKSATAVPRLNNPPKISAIDYRQGRTLVHGGVPFGPLPFTVSDVDSPVNSLTVTASSSDQRLLPSSNIFITGTNASRAITVIPNPSYAGTVTVTVTVSDGLTSNSTSFAFRSDWRRFMPIVFGSSFLQQSRSCHVEPVDCFEPNNEFTTATPLIFPTTLSATLNGKADERDYYTVNLQAGVQYVFDLTFNSGDLDVYLYLGSNQITPLAESARSNTTSEHIAFKALVSGKYYILVFNFPPRGQTTSKLRSYYLSVTRAK